MKIAKLTRQDIKEIADFAKYLKYNYNNHRKIAQTTESIDEYRNSNAFLEDYSEVADKLVQVIKEYKKKTGWEA
jgi:hypothetical protein